MVWNVHNINLFIKVKVVLIKRIHYESWFQMSILNYGCYAFIKFMMNSILFGDIYREEW